MFVFYLYGTNMKALLVEELNDICDAPHGKFKIGAEEYVLPMSMISHRREFPLVKGPMYRPGTELYVWGIRTLRVRVRVQKNNIVKVEKFELFPGRRISWPQFHSSVLRESIVTFPRMSGALHRYPIVKHFGSPSAFSIDGVAYVGGTDLQIRRVYDRRGDRSLVHVLGVGLLWLHNRYVSSRMEVASSTLDSLRSFYIHGHPRLKVRPSMRHGEFVTVYLETRPSCLTDVMRFEQDHGRVYVQASVLLDTAYAVESSELESLFELNDLELQIRPR